MLPSVRSSNLFPKFSGATPLKFNVSVENSETAPSASTFRPSKQLPETPSRLQESLQGDSCKNLLMARIFAHRKGEATKKGASPKTIDYLGVPVGSPEDLRYKYFIVTNDPPNTWHPEKFIEGYRGALLSRLYHNAENILKIFQETGDASLETAQRLMNQEIIPAFNTALATSEKDVEAWRQLKHGLENISDVPKIRDIMSDTGAIKALFQELLLKKEEALQEANPARPVQYELNLLAKPSLRNSRNSFNVDYTQPDFNLQGSLEAVSGY